MKNKLIILLIFTLFIILIFYDYYYQNVNVDSKTISIEKEYDITDISESDKSIVKEYFANGMNTESYKKILDQKENYIESKLNYEYIEYNFDNKLHYEEIEKYLQLINRSKIVKLEKIGYSADNRSIYGVEVGQGKNVLFIDANIHAAETGNTVILIKFLNDLVNKYEEGDELTISLLNNVKIALIPCLNPDGYEVYNFGIQSLNNKDLWLYENRNKTNFSNFKCNANGVDLNRNFPTQNAGLYYKNKNLISSVSFKKTTSTSSYFGGTELGSEPETKAAMYFMLKHYKNTKAYINFHSQGRVIYAGKPNLSSEFNKLCRQLGKNIKKINNYTLHSINSEEVGEGNDGTATDFMAELSNGFIFSTETGRLSTNKYIDADIEFKYKYPVLTIETLNTYTTNVEYYSKEYNKYKISKVLNYLIEYVSNVE